MTRKIFDWLIIDLFQNRSGHFSLLLPSGKQVVEVKGEGFSPVTKLITVVPGGAEMVYQGKVNDQTMEWKAGVSITSKI